MARLHVTVLEGQHQGDVLEAQFNPKEISVDRTAVWQSPPVPGAPPQLQFVRLELARMAFELLFDGVKSSTSVQPHLDALQRFLVVDPSLHRPPKVRVSWGTGAGTMPHFDGVVASLSVSYVSFGPSGVPVRATASVLLEEAVDQRVDR